jgi:hypothetical protein
MENIDPLQQKINEARRLLSKDTIEAIDSVSWRFIIQGMNTKYSPDQLEDLETETELVLCGITSPEEYQKEIQTRMNLSSTETTTLLNEMDKLIFKKIQEKLMSFLPNNKAEEISNSPIENKTGAKTEVNETKKINKRFEVLPKNLQEAISKSDYETKMYEISQKYKLPINQMGILEEAIIKTILGDINLNGLGLELKLKITLPDEEISALVNDVNTEIFKKIRMLLKYETSDVPLPPYKEEAPGDNELKIIEEKPVDSIEKEKTTKEDVPLPNYKNKTEEVPIPIYEKPLAKIDEKELYKEHGIEMMEGESFRDDESLDKHTETEDDHDHFKDSGIDIIGHKLTSQTISTPTVSDYSLPKLSKDKDIYKEEI